MNFCLSDLVPPLRWSDAARIRSLTEPVERGELPEAWWRALPMGRVLTELDAERLAELLAELSLEHWPAAAIGDILPALHVLDPDEADEPHVAIALDRVGSWTGLLALTGRELLDQPFIQARPVLTTLFAAAFTRIAEGPAAEVRERPKTEDAEPERAAEAAEREAGREAEPEAPEALPPAMFPPAGSGTFPPAASSLAMSAIESAMESGVGSAGSAAGGVPGQEGPASPAASEPEPADLFTLIDSAFADLDDQAWAVAQNRVFTDEPSEADQLAKLFAVPSERILELEERLRARLAEWLASPAAEPYQRHLEAVAETLGVAAPKSRLISAADWHTRELRSLEVPAWQFVLATLPGYQVADGWLVAGDIGELRERTSKLILDADQPPTVARALELVTTLGIHPEVAKEWLDSVPQLRGDKAADKAGDKAAEEPAEEPAAEAAQGAAAEAAEGAAPEAAEGAAAEDAATPVEGTAAPEDRPEPEQVPGPEADGEGDAPRPEAAESAPAEPAEQAAEPEAPAAEERPERHHDALAADALDADLLQADPPALTRAPEPAADPQPVPGSPAPGMASDMSPDMAADMATAAAGEPQPPVGAPPYGEPPKPLRPPYGVGPIAPPVGEEPRPGHQDTPMAPGGPDPARWADRPPMPDQREGMGPGGMPGADALSDGPAAPAPDPAAGFPGAPGGVPGVPGGAPGLPGPAPHEPQGMPAPQEPQPGMPGPHEPQGMPAPHEPQAGVPMGAPTPGADLAAAPSSGPAVRDGEAGGTPAGLKDVALTRRCFLQPDGRWWFRIDVTEDHLAGGPCAVPSGFAAYLGLTPGESRTVRCATGEITLSWQARPTLDAIRPLLIEAGAVVGGHLFVTLTEEGILRARHLPAATGTDKEQALRLVGYTAPGGSMDQALRVIATRVGMDGSASRNDLLGRLRERGDRDLLSLLATPVAP